MKLLVNYPITFAHLKINSVFKNGNAMFFIAMPNPVNESRNGALQSHLDLKSTLVVYRGRSIYGPHCKSEKVTTEQLSQIFS